jgi:hypothetical protein
MLSNLEKAVGFYNLVRKFRSYGILLSRAIF